MNTSIPQIEVMHGVNLDMLGKRAPGHYGTLTLEELQQRITRFASELGLSVSFFQSNHEGSFVERLHELRDHAQGLVLNPGAWTHYSYAIRDALELTELPAVEVHLSDVKAREPWREVSVIEDLCLATFAGEGPEGYRLALQHLRSVLQERS